MHTIMKIELNITFVQVILYSLVIIVINGASLEKIGQQVSSDNVHQKEATNCSGLNDVLPPGSSSYRRQQFLKRLQRQCKKQTTSTALCNNLQLVAVTVIGSPLCPEKVLNQTSQHSISYNDSNALNSNDFDQENTKLTNCTSSEETCNNILSSANNDSKPEKKSNRRSLLKERNGAYRSKSVWHKEEEDEKEGGGDGDWEDYEERRRQVADSSITSYIDDSEALHHASRTYLEPSDGRHFTSKDARAIQRENSRNGVETAVNDDNAMDKYILYNLKYVLSKVFGPLNCSSNPHSSEQSGNCSINLIKGASIVNLENFIQRYSGLFTHYLSDFGEKDLKTTIRHYSRAWRHNIDQTLHWIADSSKQYVNEDSTFQLQNIGRSMGRALEEWKHTIPDTVRTVVNNTRDYFKDNKEISQLLAFDEARWSRKLSVFVNWAIESGKRLFENGISSQLRSDSTDMFIEGLFDSMRKFVRKYIPDTLSTRSVLAVARSMAGYPSEATGRGKGKGKDKKLLGALKIGLLMKGGMMMAASMMGVTVLAFKALMVSTVALAMASVLVGKKLASSKGGGGGGGKAVYVESGGLKGPWVSSYKGGGGGGSGPWHSAGGGGGGWEESGGGGVWSSGGTKGTSGWHSAGGGGGWDSGGSKGTSGWHSGGGGGGWDSGGSKGTSGWHSAGGGGGGWDSGGGGDSGWDAGGGGGWSSGGSKGGGGGGWWDSGGGKGGGWDREDWKEIKEKKKKTNSLTDLLQGINLRRSDDKPLYTDPSEGLSPS